MSSMVKVMEIGRKFRGPFSPCSLCKKNVLMFNM